MAEKKKKTRNNSPRIAGPTIVTSYTDDMPEGSPERNIIVGFPLYKSVPAAFFAQWLCLDLSHVRATAVTNGVYITDAMQVLVDYALDRADNWDRLVILEHDMIVPAEAFNRISTYQSDKHIVGSVYFQHTAPHHATVFGPKPNGGPNDILPFGPDIIQKITDTPALYECSAVGFGLTTIHRSVLEDWDPDVPMFQRVKDYSHDTYFCELARKQGFKIYVDSSIVCEHITEAAVGLPHNQSYLEECLKAQEAHADTERTSPSPSD